jgi:hypothetical protein
MDDTTTKVLDGFGYPAVGRCIYCGATEGLEKEHILPFGLSGSATLPQSSCRDCARITGSVEQTVLRGPFLPVRVYRDLKSRSKHLDAPKTLPLTFVRDGAEHTIDLKIEDYPTLLQFPVFAPPVYLSGNSEYKTGILVSGVASVLYGPEPDDVAKAIGASEIKITSSSQPVAFARMIAKIAYAFAYAEGAIDDIEGDSFVLPAILGRTDDIGRWVGTLTKPIATHADQLHHMVIYHERDKGLLITEVRLFADSETPSYGVLLGKLKPECRE